MPLRELVFCKEISQKTSINKPHAQTINDKLLQIPIENNITPSFNFINHLNPPIKHHTMCCRPRCSFCCIYCTIYTLMFMFMLSIILFWIIISPSSVEFNVTDASLTQFNLTSSNTTLYYNFKVNMTARNPNNNVIVYYRRITAIAWYKDNDFGWVSLAPFDQGHKNTTFLHAVFEGKSVIKLKPRQLGEYKEETSVGVYNDLAVDLDVRIRAKFGRFKSSRFDPPIVQCRRLRVPLISNGEKTVPFSVTKCASGSFFTDRNADAGGAR